MHYRKLRDPLLTVLVTPAISYFDEVYYSVSKFSWLPHQHCSGLHVRVSCELVRVCACVYFLFSNKMCEVAGRVKLYWLDR